MTVSVVIPTFHAKDLLTTLVALQAQTIWPRIVEILVVGQQALTGWEALPKVSYLPVLDRPTPARNRNIGAGVARGEWILFTDSDCVPDPMWADSLLAAAHQEHVEAVCGSVVVGPIVSYWGLCYHLLVFAEATPESPARDVTQAATLNFGIHKSLFTALGGFDETFLSAAGEDQDFSLRLIAGGHRICFVPTACVEHRHARHQFADAWRHICGYGEAVTVRRNLRGMDRRWRFALRLLRFPGLLELAGLGRVLLRLWLHLRHLALSRPSALHALPGILVLDFALSYGMTLSLRTLKDTRAATFNSESSK